MTYQLLVILEVDIALAHPLAHKTLLVPFPQVQVQLIVAIIALVAECALRMNEIHVLLFRSSTFVPRLSLFSFVGIFAFAFLLGLLVRWEGRWTTEIGEVLHELLGGV